MATGTTAAMDCTIDPALTELYRTAARGFLERRSDSTTRTYVAPSHIPGAGPGLFAARPFVRGEWIAFYDGNVLRRVPSADTAAGIAARRRLCTLLSGALWLDGNASDVDAHTTVGGGGGGGAEYANDAYGDDRAARRRGRGHNAELRRTCDRRRCNDGLLPVIALRARRDIARDEEILVDYGAGAWRAHHQHRDAPSP